MGDFPKFLYSSLLGKYFVAKTAEDEQKLLPADGFKVIPLHVPDSSYPKQKFKVMTGETKTVFSREEEEQLSGGIWMDATRPVRFPRVLYRAEDGYTSTVENETEEKKFWPRVSCRATTTSGDRDE